MRHGNTLLLWLMAIADVGAGASIGWNNFHEEGPKTPRHFVGRYTVAPLAMRGTIEAGGDVLDFSGTIQEIEAQILKHKPDFEWADFKQFRHPAVRRREGRNDRRGWDLPPANRKAVEAMRDDFASRLRAFPIPVSGGGQCVRAGCHQDAAVWLCNDYLGWKERLEFRLADLLDHVLNNEECEVQGHPDLVQGQAFDGEEFNVLVRADTCGGPGTVRREGE
ncbi:hypothetical protein DL766_001798 [Monosporascus sp. MC13-8B]|uniref:Uncharacterized protein n=1 Tax=Monosporascus cannonballus TaxID=155416 RepID=A0ABY0HGM0_9PEZI|nr:hypothetical protein DL763_008595 [Monosporascus cannonballus]RYO92668.1 hypothetical protein DL762_001571 [Monosporascus cannonballus]RYP36762.1 hypothetical protein DL766_001798 [Monosporascus sp. MC13-8B]